MKVLKVCVCVHVSRFVCVYLSFVTLDVIHNVNVVNLFLFIT